MASILITGASGFVGRNLAAYLVNKNNHIITVSRRPVTEFVADNITSHVCSDEEFFSEAFWTSLLSNIDCVIHLAGIAHRFSAEYDNADLYFRINRDITVNLVNACVKSGVNKIIYISTIGVYGKHPDDIVDELSPFMPDNPYAFSKLEAEKEVVRICGSVSSDTKYIILRPPMIFGPSAPGNFSRLLQWIVNGRPLPFGLIENKRSMIYMENFCNVISQIILRDDIVDDDFVVADPDPVSIKELVTEMCKYSGIKCQLLPVPVTFLRIIARLTGMLDTIDTLTGNYIINAGKLYSLIDTSQFIPFKQAMKMSVSKEKPG